MTNDFTADQLKNIEESHQFGEAMIRLVLAYEQDPETFHSHCMIVSSGYRKKFAKMLEEMNK